MKVHFLCADDEIFLPHFFEEVFSQSRHEIQGVAIAEDPRFKEFLQNSFRFMGAKLFLYEVINQLGVRLRNLFYGIINQSRVSSIENVCLKYKIDFSRINRVNTDSFRSWLREKDIDVLVSVACPQILKKKLLSIPKLAAINIHYALLPFYRGQYPSFWVLAQGEEYTGVSVHHMVEKVDAGDIIIQIKEKIRTEDSFYSLVKRLKTTIGPGALLMALDKLESGDKSVINNRIEQGSYYSFPTREDMKRFLSGGRRWR